MLQKEIVAKTVADIALTDTEGIKYNAIVSQPYCNFVILYLELMLISVENTSLPGQV
jgi:hypothetical protein